jgi:hypothetical protein
MEFSHPKGIHTLPGYTFACGIFSFSVKERGIENGEKMLIDLRHAEFQPLRTSTSTRPARVTAHWRHRIDFSRVADIETCEARRQQHHCPVRGTDRYETPDTE